MNYLMGRVVAALMFGGLSLQANAQILTPAEARAHTLKVESGWQGVQVGDSAQSVEQKMGKPGSIVKGKNGRDDRWQYFTTHLSYYVVMRDGKVVSKESKLD